LNSQSFDIHADDYALSESSDNDIIELCKRGKLNSISVIPNLRIFDSSVQKFLDTKKECQSIKVSVHLNFMEGKCCSHASELPSLVDSDGYFTVSWGKLFLWNYIPILRRKIKRQLSAEITAQISKCVAAGIVDAGAIRIDSHQHPHMIPLVFEALANSIHQNDFKVEYIRNTCDPIHFYLGKKDGMKDLSISNVIKCLILNFYSGKVSRYLRKNNLENSYLCGVYFSGKMDERIRSVMPVFEAKSTAKKRRTELLFHPGLMQKNELTDEFRKTGFNEFHLSSNRKLEFNTCNSL